MLRRASGKTKSPPFLNFIYTDEEFNDDLSHNETIAQLEKKQIFYICAVFK